ncbi:hypothetical protein [Stenoxybacter acetivorans]|uniref:hypothetical protein n=1 Tax=Stenoxybacter acetivorans TaxID=422441 RepID=UPI000559D45E|nr:hypothetical protein [Stenoxybacter acetivorans]
MKKTVILLACLFPLPLLALDYDYEIDQANMKCQNESRSLLRERNGTPSCDRLQELYRIKQAQEGRLLQERQADKPQRVIVQPHQSDTDSGTGYRWNRGYGKYCDHNSDGYPIRCDD